MASKSSEPREDVLPKSRSSENKKQSKGKGTKYLQVPPNAFKPSDNRRPPDKEQNTTGKAETKTEKRPTSSASSDKHPTLSSSKQFTPLNANRRSSAVVQLDGHRDRKQKTETEATHSAVEQWMLSRIGKCVHPQRHFRMHFRYILKFY